MEEEEKFGSAAPTLLCIYCSAKKSWAGKEQNKGDF
jgi:hypothetical protein